MSIVVKIRPEITRDGIAVRILVNSRPVVLTKHRTEAPAAATARFVERRLLEVMATCAALSPKDIVTYVMGDGLPSDEMVLHTGGMDADPEREDVLVARIVELEGRL